VPGGALRLGRLRLQRGETGMFEVTVEPVDHA
jgi:hypothetical protein